MENLVTIITREERLNSITPFQTLVNDDPIIFIWKVPVHDVANDGKPPSCEIST